jgi:hypothetical protein
MNYVTPGYVRTGYISQDSDTIGPFRFDGHGRFVFVSPSLQVLSIPDLYSRWKDWLGVTHAGVDNNIKWPAAMKYSGNDPIPGGFTGATFFMFNGWRLRYDPNSTSIAGVLFSEDFNTAYWSLNLQPIYPVTVSAVVNQVTSTQTIVTGDLDQVASLVRAELAQELARLDVSVSSRASQADVWGAA